MKTPNFVFAAIKELCHDAEFSVIDNDLSTLKWLDTKIPRPSDKDILDKVEELKGRQVVGEYRNKRIGEYPSIGDQLDALYHAGVFPEEMASKIAAVKNKFPKP